MLEQISLKIRKRETPFYEKLYSLAKTLRSLEVPVIPVLHSFLYNERTARLAVYNNLTRVLYHTPLFKSRCTEVGKRLNLVGGVPLVQGDLSLVIGDDVTLYGYSTLSGAKVFDKPTLKIGSNSVLGYQLVVTVGADVTIGANALIAERVMIMSYDGHPANPELRHLPAAPESSRPINIGNYVWLGAGSTILKGVSIGDGSIIAAGSVVTVKAPPNSLVIGNPARVFPLMI